MGVAGVRIWVFLFVAYQVGCLSIAMIAVGVVSSVARGLALLLSHAHTNVHQ